VPEPTQLPQPLQGEPAARVLVAGASGFAGALAAQLAWRHPRLELRYVTSRSDAGLRLDQLYPRYRVPLELSELDIEEIEDCDAAIVAYPHGAAAPVVAGLRGLGLQVVDLSADFRLRDPEAYREWYGELGEPELLPEAVYGLPELYREQVAAASLVANPGCYPTATILALAPLAAQGLIEDVVVDAKSGVSGAGRGGGDALHFVSLDENVYPYGVEGHRHQPEIAQELSALSGAPAPDLTFVPHLVPLDQGELVSCYVRPSRELSDTELAELYSSRYESEPFVELVGGPPGMRDVRDTNVCRIHVASNRGRVLVFAAIDNLWKGAASQAIQNLNLMLGLPEGEGIS
jgi:N-acetyl-gamma-glutamyl-phosphate reductase